ncbi:MAG: hypothetical protein WBM06_21745 [Pseudolabrys sp.]|jgi:DNA-binding FadR family transcriptional regulator
MSEDKMLAEIGISAEELDEAFRRLERHGFLKLELGSDGKIISFTRTEKPFCKVEWDDADPRVCQLATDLMTKVLPMLDEERNEEIDRALRNLERDGVIEMKQGDGDIIVSLTAKGRARNPRCDYTL